MLLASEVRLSFIDEFFLRYTIPKKIINVYLDNGIFCWLSIYDLRVSSS